MVSLIKGLTQRELKSLLKINKFKILVIIKYNNKSV